MELLRIKQWIKNLFIFIPAFFAGVLFDETRILDLILAFFAFSLTASAVYILNDYVDVEKDKLHPEKKNRPLASGKISKTNALLLFCIVLLLGIGGSALLLPTNFTLICAAYFVMNIAYTFFLKNVAIVDVSTIATGFVLRVLAGGAVADVPITNWLIVITFLLALVMAIGKRRGEYIAQDGETQTRTVLAGYNLPFLNTALAFSCTITVVSYIMYTVSEEVILRFGNDYIYMTTLFVILGVLRYLQQSMVFNRSESPTKMLYKDTFIQVVLVGWVVSFLAIIYGGQLGWW